MSDLDTLRAVRCNVGIPVKPVQGLKEINLAGRDRDLLNRKRGGDGKRP